MNDENYDPEKAFHENVAKARSEMQAQGLDPSTGLPADGSASHVSQRVAPSNINRDLLAEAERRQTERDEHGRRRYEIDEAYRHETEKMRAAAMKGEQYQPQAPAAQPAQQQPAQPQQQPAQSEPSSPGEQAAQALSERLEAGEVIARDHVGDAAWQAMTGGYTVNLPQGYGLSGEHVGMLQAAREAGVSQAEVDRVVASMLKGS